MKPEYLKIHNECLRLCRGRVKGEAPIVAQLQMVIETKLYRELDIKNPYMYAVDICGLSEGDAYVFIAIAKKATLYPCFQDAIVQRTLSISKANRIVSIIDAENAEELVQFAKTHKSKEIEREVRRRNPKAAVRSKIKPLTADTDLLQSTIPRETTENISRAQTILAQKTSKHQGLPETLTLVFKDYVERHDPLRKAQRAQERQTRSSEIARNSAHAEKRENSSHGKKSAYAEKTTHAYGRIPFTAAELHTVDLRDERRCTHIGKDGKRCNESRWTRYHHIVHVADGGTNHPNNITTLCYFHHDLVHQQVFPMDGERSWLRSPQREYLV